MGLPGHWLTAKSGVPKARTFEKSERGRMLFLGPDVSNGHVHHRSRTHLDINSAEQSNVTIVIDVNPYSGAPIET
jgi:hypothetical protein